MEHFANFGIVKKANKQLKRLNELSETAKTYGYQKRENDFGHTKSGLGEIAKNTPENYLDKRKSELLNNTLSNGRKVKSNEALDYYTENPTVNDKTPFRVLSPDEEWIPPKALSRGMNRVKSRLTNDLPSVSRNMRSSEEYVSPSRLLTQNRKDEPNRQDFTDIRKTDDRAASPTGYLGFRTDPYKGYGGMMEEPVDVTTTITKLPRPRVIY